MQKEITELRNRYETQLRDQGHLRDELVRRTRDLQRAERKNIKYRENNRLLADAVQSLENRNLSAAAGSGGATQPDMVVMYEHALRETNGDLIENMEYIDDDDANPPFDAPQPEEIIPGRGPQSLYPFDGNNVAHDGGASAGLYSQHAELNSGEHG